MVIGMDRGLTPDRPVEGRRGQGEQQGPLRRLEHDARHLPRRPVEPGPGQLSAPRKRAGLHLGQVPEGLPPEEVLAGVRDAPFDLRLPRGMDRHGGVDHEAPGWAYSRNTLPRVGA